MARGDILLQSLDRYIQIPQNYISASVKPGADVYQKKNNYILIRTEDRRCHPDKNIVVTERDNIQFSIGYIFIGQQQ